MNLPAPRGHQLMGSSDRATMKALLIFPLLAAILWASPVSTAAAEPCNDWPARVELRGALRRAAASRPVNVSFDIRAAGVTMPDWLAARYVDQDEMIVVLQHQFHRLQLLDDRFEVGLWFKGRYARLVIPFTAIKGLWDNKEWKCGNA
jgi:uncharacterized protein